MSSFAQIGDIVQGKIVRIEAYGAFCEISPENNTHYSNSNNSRRGGGGGGGGGRPLRGLIHISKLATFKVEKVDDVVAVDDIVWVKVVDIEQQQTDNGSARLKVSLSLKDAAQDGSRRDVGAEEQAEQDAKHFISTQLESSLNSTIGMGIALDPMDTNAQRRLLMKHDKNNSSSFAVALFNGYSLVDDTEGEPDLPLLPASTAMRNQESVLPLTGGLATSNSTRLAPMGRGRGATLPAWMTQQDTPQQQQEGPTGMKEDESRNCKDKTKHHRKDKKRRRDMDSEEDRSVQDGGKHRKKRKGHRASSSRRNSRASKSDARKTRHRRDKSLSVNDDNGEQDGGRGKKATNYSDSSSNERRGHSQKRRTHQRKSRNMSIVHGDADDSSDKSSNYSSSDHGHRKKRDSSRRRRVKRYAKDDDDDDAGKKNDTREKRRSRRSRRHQDESESSSSSSSIEHEIRHSNDKGLDVPKAEQRKHRKDAKFSHRSSSERIRHDRSHSSVHDDEDSVADHKQRRRRVHSTSDDGQRNRRRDRSRSSTK
jgi:predicted RNA-binding protein with RPS1 domain